MTKYHISAKGNPAICRAKYSCRLGGNNEHFNSKERAALEVEMRNETEFMENPDKTAAAFIAKRHKNPEKYSYYAHLYEDISEKKYGPWTAKDKKSLVQAQKVVELAHAGEFETAYDIYERIEDNRVRYSGKRTRMHDLKMLTHTTLDYSYNKSKPDFFTKDPDYTENTGLVGVRDAAVNVLKEETKYYGEKRDDKGLIIPWMSDEKAESMIAYASSRSHDQAESDYEKLNDHESGVFGLSENNLIVAATGESQQLYLTAGFPNRELKEEMEKQGVSNVFVSSFLNGREAGLTYTVMVRGNQTRTFSVYEHRNFDTVVINGQTNWNGEDLPYTADDKHRFFAEIPGGEYQRVAKDLTYFLKAAQNNILDDDDTLDERASRVDHMSNLIRTIPGFADWVKRQGGTLPDENPSDDEILKNLDFKHNEEW